VAEDSPEVRGESLRGRLGSRGEEALGKFAQDLLENSWVNSALTAALEARGRASQAQEVAMEFLNLPSASQIERLTRRVRSLSQRLESIEDALARLEDGLRATPSQVAARLDAIEQQLSELAVTLSELRAHTDGAAMVSRDQERLRVEDAGRAADQAAAAERPAVGGAG
jgi:chromosome segregation ATPase